MTEERGQRLVMVSRLFLPGPSERRPAVKSDLPGDARLEAFRYLKGCYGYVLRLSSTAWDAVEEGEPIPVEPTITHHYEATFAEVVGE